MTLLKQENTRNNTRRALCGAVLALVVSSVPVRVLW